MLLELINIFNHKKNYIEYLNERNSNLRKEIRDIKSSYRENNKVKDNLFEIISKDEIIFNIYEYCDNTGSGYVLHYNNHSYTWQKTVRLKY